MAYPQPIPAPPLAPEVAHVAHNYNMGTLRETFQPRRLVGYIVAYSIVAAVCFIVTVAVPFAGGEKAGRLALTAIFGTLLLLILAALTWALLHSPATSAAARERKFYAFDNGYIQVTKAGPVPHRWDSVSSVYQEIVQRSVNGVRAGTFYTYRLTFADGSTSKLNNNTIDLEKFGPVLMREVARAQLPRAGAALQAGQTIAFGDFAISRQGVSIKGKAPVPWSSVKKVDVAAGYVRLMQDGKWLPTTRQASKVPNLYTFIMLVDQLAGNSAPATGSATRQ